MAILCYGTKNTLTRVTEKVIITGIFTKSHKEYHDGAHCKTLFINGKFHVFGGWNCENKAHYVWNEIDKDLKEIHKFTDEEITVATLFGFIASNTFSLN